jgi:hypothetical protein
MLRSGSFPLRGKSKEYAAYEFWKWIQKEHPFEIELQKVICDAEDITEQVKEIEKKYFDDLPF